MRLSHLQDCNRTDAEESILGSSSSCSLFRRPKLCAWLMGTGVSIVDQYFTVLLLLLLLLMMCVRITLFWLSFLPPLSWDEDSGGSVRSGPDSTRILHASCMQKPPCELRVPTYGYLWAPNGKPAKPLLCFEFRRRRRCGSGALTLTIAVAIQLDYITGGGMACPGTVPFGGASTRKAAVR